MSDFLGNLVARSLAPAAQINPRLPSPFEPPQDSGIQTGVAPWLEAESGPGEQDVVGSVPAPAATPRSEARPQPAVPEPGDLSPPDEATGPPPYRGLQLPPAGPTRVAIPDPAPYTGRQLLTGASTSIETSARDAAPEPSSPPGPVRPLPEPRAGESVAPEPAGSMPVEPALPGRETMTQEMPSPPALALPTREGATIVARPRTRLAQPAEPVPAEGEQPAPGPESPPTIRVTIGRVEVRAVMPPAPEPAPPPRHAPRLSLDDYLKQRSGGSP